MARHSCGCPQFGLRGSFPGVSYWCSSRRSLRNFAKSWWSSSARVSISRNCSSVILNLASSIRTFSSCAASFLEISPAHCRTVSFRMPSNTSSMVTIGILSQPQAPRCVVAERFPVSDVAPYHRRGFVAHLPPDAALRCGVDRGLRLHSRAERVRAEYPFRLHIDSKHKPPPQTVDLIVLGLC